MKRTKAGALGLLAGAVAALAIGTISTSANATTLTATASTTVNATVNSVISISSTVNPIVLTGNPNSTAGPATSGFNVITNDSAGYAVTVQATAANMTGQRSGNTDVIPVADLQATTVGGTTYASLSSTTPLALYSKSSASAAAGDANNFNLQLNTPFVSADTYSVGLTYTVTGN